MDESVFPDVRWGSERSVLRGPMAAFGATKPGSWLIRTLTPLDRRLLQRSRGRFTMLGPIGAPTLLLTTIGRKSGLPRTTPLLYHREGNALYVVGSNFGQSHHPAWSGNLLAEPTATATMAGKDIPVRATLLRGNESERVFGEFVKIAVAYRAYRGRTDRELRVFKLEPNT